MTMYNYAPVRLRLNEKTNESVTVGLIVHGLAAGELQLFLEPQVKGNPGFGSQALLLLQSEVNEYRSRAAKNGPAWTAGRFRALLARREGVVHFGLAGTTEAGSMIEVAKQLLRSVPAGLSQ
jgi:hypothetical protein